jgi:hypothetical protein
LPEYPFQIAFHLPEREVGLFGQARCPPVRILFDAIELGLELEVAHLKIMLDSSTQGQSPMSHFGPLRCPMFKRFV